MSEWIDAKQELPQETGVYLGYNATHQLWMKVWWEADDQRFEDMDDTIRHVDFWMRVAAPNVSNPKE